MDKVLSFEDRLLRHQIPKWSNYIVVILAILS